jgi:hypothetical protein
MLETLHFMIHQFDELAYNEKKGFNERLTETPRSSGLRDR